MTEVLFQHSNNNPHLLSSIDAIGSQWSSSSSALLLSAADAAASSSSVVYEGGGDDPTAAAAPGMLSKQTAITVFIVGLVPWTVATFEFWRRIAVGASFGTNDPVVIVSTIGEDDNPASSRGRQVLGKGALITAYAIFTVVAAVLGLVVYSVLSSTAAATVPLSLSPPS